MFNFTWVLHVLYLWHHLLIHLLYAVYHCFYILYMKYMRSLLRRTLNNKAWILSLSPVLFFRFNICYHHLPQISVIHVRLNKRTKPKLLRLTSNDYNLRERVGSLSVKICNEIERDILKNSKEYNYSLKKINYVDAIFLQTWPFYISSTVGVFICAHILCFFSI